MTLVFGVDFSGAQDAGEHIWVTRGRLDRGVLRIHEITPASELPDGGPSLEEGLNGLRELIASTGRGAFGIDAPFGLPAELVEAEDWHSFARGFSKRYEDPEAFREACQAASDEELKRVTDQERSTPWSPYNLRMHKQTFHLIADVLAPLIDEVDVAILPMDDPEPDRPWLMEVCPSVTLNEEGIHETYKGTGPDRRDARVRLLRELETLHSISLPARRLRARLLEDAHGDGLDSLVAAHAVARNISDPSRMTPRDLEPYLLEGYVYV